MSDVWDADILGWTEGQAALLRRRGAGELVDGELDWTDIAEEIESLGWSETRACQSGRPQAAASHPRRRAPLPRTVIPNSAVISSTRPWWSGVVEDQDGLLHSRHMLISTRLAAST